MRHGRLDQNPSARRLLPLSAARILVLALQSWLPIDRHCKFKQRTYPISCYFIKIALVRLLVLQNKLFHFFFTAVLLVILDERGMLKMQDHRHAGLENGGPENDGIKLVA